MKRRIKIVALSLIIFTAIEFTIFTTTEAEILEKTNNKNCLFVEMNQKVEYKEKILINPISNENKNAIRLGAPGIKKFLINNGAPSLYIMGFCATLLYIRIDYLLSFFNECKINISINDNNNRNIITIQYPMNNQIISNSNTISGDNEFNNRDIINYFFNKKSNSKIKKIISGLSY